MASTSSTYMSTSATFKIPLEPAPVPSVTNRMSSPSDEESFVVLGKSLADFDESAISLDRFSEVNSLGVNIIQEAKELTSQELSQIEKQVEQVGLVENDHPETANNDNGNVNVTDLTAENNVLPELSPGEKPANNSPQDKLISIVSFSPSEIVSEELQQKISQLVDENIHLKDTILQNNISMKAQYERIVAWQEDVQKVHETHKEKFLQAKQYIGALKQENFNLKQEIEKLSDALVKVKTEHAEQIDNLNKSSDMNIKEFELEAVNKKLKEELDAARKKLDENKCDSAFQEKLNKYEKELEDAYKKIRGLEIEVQKRKSVAEVELEQTVNQIKNVELNKDKDIIEAERKLLESQKNIREVETKDFQVQISTLKGVIESKNATLSESQSKIQDLNDKLNDMNACRQQLEIQIKSLKGELEEAKIDAWRNKSKEAEKEKMYQEQIQSMKASMNSCNTYQQASSPNYEVENLRQQLMQSQIALTNCEQNRVAACGQIEGYKRHLEDLQKQVAEFPARGDDEFALKTQLELYKADFEAERSAKDAMKIEKDKLAEDLQHLHRRNQQLQEEIEILRPQVRAEAIPHRPRSHDTSSSGESAWSNQNHFQLFKCPKCNFGFHTLNACENHVMRCIELEDSLP